MEGDIHMNRDQVITYEPDNSIRKGYWSIFTEMSIHQELKWVKKHPAPRSTVSLKNPNPRSLLEKLKLFESWHPL